MFGFGAALLLLGVASFALPKFGVPLGIRFVPQEYQLHAQIAATALGAALILLSFRKKPEKK
jgi:hypothetical protein